MLDEGHDIEADPQRQKDGLDDDKSPGTHRCGHFIRNSLARRGSAFGWILSGAALPKLLQKLIFFRRNMYGCCRWRGIECILTIHKD